MKDITYIRTLNKVITNRFLIFSIIKGIVTFYYNSFCMHPNIFKNYKKVSISNTEHKNCLAFLKAAGSSNINYIY